VRVLLLIKHSLNIAIIQQNYKPRSGQTKECKIGMCCFSAKNASLRRKSKDWLARNRNNVSKWSDMSTQSTQCVGLKQFDIIVISLDWISNTQVLGISLLLLLHVDEGMISVHTNKPNKQQKITTKQKQTVIHRLKKTIRKRWGKEQQAQQPLTVTGKVWGVESWALIAFLPGRFPTDYLHIFTK
jgi:hypothetical protein